MRRQRQRKTKSDNVLLLIILGSIYLLLTILDSQFKVMNAQSIYVFMIVDVECMFYIVY